MSFNLEIKGTLAKLLATENLIVEHKNVETASFNVDTRELVLPMWRKASSFVYDLLVGHEVGHALYTPNYNWMEDLKVPKDYVNVVEDVRVEKLMKRKFPGISKSFYKGYKELSDQDFFGAMDKNTNTFSLIDRINLYYKIGNYVNISFREEEKYFIDKINSVETFQEVLDICKELYDFVRNQKQEVVDKQEQQQLDISSSSFPGESQSKKFETSEEVSDELEEKKDAPSAGDGLEGGESGGDITKSETQSNFDEKLSDLNQNTSYSTDNIYVEIPKVNLDKVIVPCNTLEKYINSVWSQPDQSSLFFDCDSNYKKYKEESRKEVNYLVKEFECKKSADSYARSTVSRTGVLDTAKLHTYKYNEDLFKKVSVIPDGKNHGLIFILDWSSSMQDYILDTIKQLLNLVWFCKKVQIPFEVYAFTFEWNDNYLPSNKNKEEGDDPYYPYQKSSDLYEVKHQTIDLHSRFRLLNLISSTSKTKSFESQCLNIWRLAHRYDRHNYSYYNVPYGLEMSGTPLDESIICLHEIIPMFKNREKLQKVNVIILTDGEGHPLQYNIDMNKVNNSYEKNVFGKNRIDDRCILRDRKTGHTYKSFDYYDWNRNSTNILLSNLKDNYPYVNLIGFRILSGGDFFRLAKGINSYQDIEKYQKVWKKEKSYEFKPEHGYDSLYTIASSNLDSNSKQFEVSDDATNAQITKAFKTMLKKKSLNKKLLSSFTSMVA